MVIEALLRYPITGLLRAHRERPHRCRPADQPDELAPSHHSITSSARACDQRQGVQCVAM